MLEIWERNVRVVRVRHAGQLQEDIRICFAMLREDMYTRIFFTDHRSLTSLMRMHVEAT